MSDPVIEPFTTEWYLAEAQQSHDALRDRPLTPEQRELWRTQALAVAALRMLAADRDASLARSLHEYADRLDAVPVDCKALTGPVWYGQGWHDAVSHLRDLADAITPAPCTGESGTEATP